MTKTTETRKKFFLEMQDSAGNEYRYFRNGLWTHKMHGEWVIVYQADVPVTFIISALDQLDKDAQNAGI